MMLALAVCSCWIETAVYSQSIDGIKPAPPKNLRLGDSQYTDNGGSTPRAVATFHAAGLYWAPSNGSSSKTCAVRYRQINGAWQSAMPLWFDSRSSEYRGSIVNLRPNTSYEIEVSLAGSTTGQRFSAATRSETFPVQKTISLPEQSNARLKFRSPVQQTDIFCILHRRENLL